MRADLQEHLRGCEHCEVTLSTTRKTIQIYRSHEFTRCRLVSRDGSTRPSWSGAKRAANLPQQYLHRKNRHPGKWCCHPERSEGSAFFTQESGTTSLCATRPSSQTPENASSLPAKGRSPAPGSLELRAFWPASILIQPRSLLMRIDQYNLIRVAGQHFLRFQAERSSRSPVSRNPVRQIGKHHNE